MTDQPESYRPLNKPFSAMSVEELKLEREYWTKMINDSGGWGASLAACIEFKKDCETQLRMRGEKI